MALDQTLLDDLNATCLSELGDVDITVNGATVEAVFSDEYADLGELGVGVGSSAPYIEVLSKDIPGVGSGAEVVANGKLYRVVGPAEPDGLGMTILRLEEA